MEMGSQGGEDLWQGSWRTWAGEAAAEEQADPHLHADKLGGTTGERDRQRNPGFQHGEIKPQNLTEKTCGG